MPSAERFKRVALIAIISLVIGASTLANLLKQTPPPEDALARAAAASERPSASPTSAPRADVVPSPAEAAKPEVPTRTPPAPVTTAAVPAPAPALPSAPVAEPPVPAVPPVAHAGEFPPMQPMTDDAAKSAAAAATTAARPQRADTAQRTAEKPATEKPAAEKPAAEKPAAEKSAAEKPDVKRSADGRSTKHKRVRPEPYPMRDFLTSHR